jgi:hypothetical protein
MRRFRTDTLITCLVVALALFVFVFALNAKLALCHPVGPEQSRTALKLYLNGQKITVDDGVVVGQSVLLTFVLVALFLAARPSRLAPRFVFARPAPCHAVDFFAEPHLSRPPPSV